MRTTADQQGGIHILILVCVCSLPLASVNTDLGGIQILILVCVCSLPLASVNTDLGGIQILILVLWCCHHGGSAGRHTDLEDVQPFEFLCSFWKSSSSVFPMTIAASIIGAATQLLLALLRSYFGAATQLLSALLRSYYRRCYAAIIGAATTADQQGWQ